MSNKSKDISESTLVTTGAGSVANIVINSHSSGVIKLVDGLEDSSPATGTLTSSGAVTVAQYGTATLTVSGAVSDGETITIGSTVYRAKTTPAQAYDVALGGSTAEFLDNLKLAINATGTAGTNYYAGTLVHPSVIATTNTDTTQIIRTRTIGNASVTTTLNAIATTETMANGSWGGATMSGAVTTDGSTFTIDSVTYTAVLTLAETLGLTAVPYQVLWVTSEAVFLDNIKKAINGSGTAGTDYSTGTEVHPTVYATTNTNTAQTVVSKLTGTSQNSIVTTETMANYAWGAGTLASGTGSTGRILNSGMTLSAVATTGERYILLSGEEFYTGLYVSIVSGTADISVVYSLNK